MDWYKQGYALGELKLQQPKYDARWDFADAAKAGSQAFTDLKRGFNDALHGKEASDVAPA